MNTPNVNFKVTDLTEQVSTPTDGITFVVGKSLRGPINKPSDIISNWGQFVKLFGGLTPDSSTLPIKRLLEKGGLIRFANVAHYTTIATASSLSALKASPDEDILDAEDPANILFELNPKYPGADYNNLVVRITAASNGMANYFNLSIEHALEPELNELYPNLFITGQPTVETSNYLSAVVEGSKLVDVTYEDLSAITGQIRPINAVITFAGGTNGGTIVDADIIGDSASSTGIRAFDDYDDSYQLLIAMNTISTAVHVAAAAYANTRQDLIYFLHLSKGLTDKAALISARTALNIDSPYVYIMAGGLKVSNPINSQVLNIDGQCDVAALAANSDKNNGPWFSFAGNNRGVITNTLGVVTNFGTPGRYADKNELANRQINVIVNETNQVKLWGSLTAQVANTQTAYLNVVRLIIFLKKSLKPILNNYLEEPNDMTSWKLMYYQVKPFLDSLKDERALYSYEWLGDQDAKSLQDLQINDAADVTAGKYKVKLLLSVIPAMREIEVNLVLTPGNISFELANQLT